MEQGPHEKAIITQAMRQNRPLPKKIQDAPSLLPGLELYYIAFWDLTTCRPVGMTLGPIPWNFIEDYADRRELNDDQRWSLHYHIKEMDAKYLTHVQKQAKKK